MTNKYVPRTLEKKFKKLARIYRVITLVGPRQSGKTTLLKKMLQESSGRYISLDDPDARKLFNSDIKKFETQFLEREVPIGIDEVQYGNEAGIKIKYLADKGYTLWITSSSERILSRDVLGYLVGRTTILRLYPFSLEEYRTARDIRVYDPQIEERLIWEHSLWGGYPRVALVDDPEIRTQILRDIRETLILKDVMLNFSVDKLTSMEKLVEFLAFNVGQTISYETIQRTVSLSHQTLDKYLDALEKSYVIKRVRPFFTNRNKELSKRPKVFFIDTGLRNAVLNDWRLDGPLFENYVFTELIKLGKEPRYWRTKTKLEVDFVVDGIPIEAKLTEPRITAGLKSFIRTYSPDLALIVTLKEGEEKEVIVGNTPVVATSVSRLRKYLV